MFSETSTSNMLVELPKICQSNWDNNTGWLDAIWPTRWFLKVWKSQRKKASFLLDFLLFCLFVCLQLEWLCRKTLRNDQESSCESWLIIVAKMLQMVCHSQRGSLLCCFVMIIEWHFSRHVGCSVTSIHPHFHTASFT